MFRKKNGFLTPILISSSVRNFNKNEYNLTDFFLKRNGITRIHGSKHHLHPHSAELNVSYSSIYLKEHMVSHIEIPFTYSTFRDVILFHTKTTNSDEKLVKIYY